MKPTDDDAPPWFQRAVREIGVKEKFGHSDNTRILQYFEDTKTIASHDETPWCAAFVCWCLEKEGVRSTRSARAASFATYGDPVMAKRGAIVVLGKSDPDAGGSGHVAFFDSWGKDKTTIWVLGGNQANMVSIAERPTARIVAVRWPNFP